MIKITNNKIPLLKTKSTKKKKKKKEEYYNFETHPLNNCKDKTIKSETQHSSILIINLLARKINTKINLLETTVSHPRRANHGVQNHNFNPRRSIKKFRGKVGIPLDLPRLRYPRGPIRGYAEKKGWKERERKVKSFEKP